MCRVFTGLRTILCLILALQLALPLSLWAEPDPRDLRVEALEQVEAQKQGVTLWVLAIGVSQYEDPRISLRFADHDALSIAQMLRTQEGVLFREVFTKVLTNQEATREAILKAMSEFLGQAASDDVVLIFVAGHGQQDRQTLTYYFVPYDANAENLISNGLPMQSFEEAIKRLRSTTEVHKVVLWLDTCHAGAVDVAMRGMTLGDDLGEALQQASGQWMLLASKAGQESMEDNAFRFPEEEKGHGAFTYSLLNGLRGAAADSNKVVTLTALFDHVSTEVPRLTKAQQNPYSKTDGTNLPLFVLNKSVMDKLNGPLDPQDHGPELPPISDSEPLFPIELPLIPDDDNPPWSKKWLWLLLAAAAGGGGVVVGLKPGAEKVAPPPPTGSVRVDIPVP